MSKEKGTLDSGSHLKGVTHPEEKKKLSLREFFSMGEVGGYFFRKKDPNRPTNVNIKMMHGVNKLSIAIFLAAVVYLILKHLL